MKKLYTALVILPLVVLTFNSSARAYDEVEPNKTYIGTTANTPAYDDITYGSVDGSTDVDYFKFDMPSGNFTVNFKNHKSAFNLTGRLYYVKAGTTTLTYICQLKDYAPTPVLSAMGAGTYIVKLTGSSLKDGSYFQLPYEFSFSDIEGAAAREIPVYVTIATAGTYNAKFVKGAGTSKVFVDDIEKGTSTAAAYTLGELKEGQKVRVLVDEKEAATASSTDGKAWNLDYGDADTLVVSPAESKIYTQADMDAARGASFLAGAASVVCECASVGKRGCGYNNNGHGNKCNHMDCSNTGRKKN
jgi:hypothetical protein